MIRNQAGQSIGAQMVSAATGTAFTTAVTVYITIDSGLQQIGTVNAGLCTHEGNGYHTYQPAQTETDGALVAFTFIANGAIPQTIQVATVTAAQTQALQTSTGSGVITVGDLITAALRRINVLQAGEVPSPEDSSDALLRFKMMLGSWRLQNLTIPFLERTTWTITSTKGTLASPYTIGLGGDINVARPPLANEISVRYQDTSVTPTLERRLTPLTDDAWIQIPQKNLTSPLPSAYYYKPTYAGSLGSLYLWMVPTQSQLQGVLYAPASIQDYSSLSDSILLPDGYTLALQDNLAMVLWPEWREHVQMDPELRESARESKAVLKASNLRMSDLTVDPALTCRSGVRYSIFSDGPS